MSNENPFELESLRFVVQGADGAVYGPATVANLADWVKQQRLSGELLVAPEGTTNWQRADSVPQLAGLFPRPAAAQDLATPSTPVFAPSSTPAPTYDPATTQSYASTPPVNGLAIASLVCGLVSVVCVGAPVTSILGLVFGIIARKQIRASGGQKSGDAQAMAGIICGSISLGLCGLGGIFYAVMIALAIAGGVH